MPRIANWTGRLSIFILYLVKWLGFKLDGTVLKPLTVKLKNGENVSD